MSAKKNSRPIIWLSVREAAAVFRRHPATIRKWAARGDLSVRRTPSGRMQIKGCIKDGETEVFVNSRLMWTLNRMWR